MLDIVCNRYKQAPSDYLEKNQYALAYDFVIAITAIREENKGTSTDERTEDMLNKLSKFKSGA